MADKGIQKIINWFKGTESVISSDSPCKDSSVRFTTVPLKLKSDKKFGRYRRLSDSEVFIFVTFFIGSIVNNNNG